MGCLGKKVSSTDHVNPDVEIPSPPPGNGLLTPKLTTSSWGHEPSWRTAAGSSRGKLSSACAFLLMAVGRVTSLNGTNGATATTGYLSSTRTRLWSVLEHPFQYKCQMNNRWVHPTSPVTIKWPQQGSYWVHLCFLKAQLQEGWYDLHIFFSPKSVKRCAPD